MWTYLLGSHSSTHYTGLWGRPQSWLWERDSLISLHCSHLEDSDDFLLLSLSPAIPGTELGAMNAGVA